uniref:Integrase p58-like C-terminal domain-containing protein n=1 Tax=Romanomermis culicivorax TaxID=13658 RepID=A0A915ICI5_ROMCU
MTYKEDVKDPIRGLNDEGIQLEILKQYCDSLDQAIGAAENEASLCQVAKHQIPKITRGFEATTVCAKREVEEQTQDVPHGARRPPGPRNWGEGHCTGSPLQLEQQMIMARQLELESIRKAQQQQKKLYDRRKQAVNLEAGQPVWLVNSRRAKEVEGKLQPHWIGPYVVVQKVSAVNYIIRALNTKALGRTVHADHLHLHHKQPEDNVEAERVDAAYVTEITAIKPMGHFGNSGLSEAYTMVEEAENNGDGSSVDAGAGLT